MAWCPFAQKLELQPESDQQPAIRPTQFIVHSVVAPWSVQRLFEYWKSTSLESHFGLAYDGSLGQFIGTQTRADANAGANRRADGTGAVSIETASNTKASDPWTPEQIEQLIQLGVWLHKTHGIPLRICRTASDPGFGYHRLHREWSTSGTACPGDARVRQFREVVFPGIVARANGTTPPPQEDSMTVTNDDAELIARKVLTLDGVITNPVEGSTNTHISLATSARNIEIVARRTEAKVAALTEANAKLVDTVAQLAAGLGDLDPAAIVTELKQAIESIDVHITTDHPEA
jgi:hypothetical protein